MPMNGYLRNHRVLDVLTYSSAIMIENTYISLTYSPVLIQIVTNIKKTKMMERKAH